MAAEALNRGGIDEGRARLYLNEVRLRADYQKYLVLAQDLLMIFIKNED